MRKVTIFFLAVAFTTPAPAQNVAIDNAANVSTGNTVDPPAAPAGTATAPVNGLTAAPGMPVTTAETTAPAPTAEETTRTGRTNDGGMPWGLLGLVGLAGLLGRKRRSPA